MVERKLDLLRDGSGRDGVRKCIAPEIAHDAAEWALAVSEENGGDVFEVSVGGRFLFCKVCEGFVGVECGACEPLSEYPVIPLCGTLRIARQCSSR